MLHGLSYVRFQGCWRRVGRPAQDLQGLLYVTCNVSKLIKRRYSIYSPLLIVLKTSYAKVVVRITKWQSVIYNILIVLMQSRSHALVSETAVSHSVSVDLTWVLANDEGERFPLDWTTYCGRVRRSHIFHGFLVKKW